MAFKMVSLKQFRINLYAWHYKSDHSGLNDLVYLVVLIMVLKSKTKLYCEYEPD